MAVQTSAVENCWQALKNHYEKIKSSFNLNEAFAKDAKRFEKYSIEHKSEQGSLLVDYSKNLVDEEAMKLLCELAKACEVEQWRDKMFAGEPINFTENRSVLHVALRAVSNFDEVEKVFAKPTANGLANGNQSNEKHAKLILKENQQDVYRDVQTELLKMKIATDDVRSGTAKGATGKRIKSIINIGIGGSDLGPLMVYEALKPYAKSSGLQVHYVSNVDGMHLSDAIDKCNAEETLVVVVSKTFTTAETMLNVKSARRWILDAFRNKTSSAPTEAEIIDKHFVAISTNAAKVAKFGIDPEKNMFKFWDWVGGRYSLWSAVGWSICAAIGFENFVQMLRGAESMDVHFKKTPIESNIPVQLALIGVWYNECYGCQSHAILPYEQSLQFLPFYLQQADMESNGKYVTRDGTKTKHSTGPIVWGSPGTNCQHAYFQLLHQGTKIVPCDFIAGCNTHNPQPTAKEHHKMLLANFFAQTEALMRGRSSKDVEADGKTAPSLVPHRVFEGNRPSTTLLYDVLSPWVLGALLALYEHKIFVQGIIWRINSYDQWGVELGKQLAGCILNELEAQVPPSAKAHDSSTTGLMRYFLQATK